MHFLNKAFNSILLTTTLAFSSQMAFAAPATEKSVNQLITLSHIDQIFNEGVQNLQPFFKEEATFIIQNVTQTENLNTQQESAAQQLAKTMSDLTAASLKDPKVVVKIRDIVRETYTEEELKAYIKFLSTPEGQSINLKSTKVSIQLQTFMEDLIKNATNNDTFEKQVERILTPLLEK